MAFAVVRPIPWYLLMAEEHEDIEFLKMPDVLKRTGVKRTKLYAMIKEGEFPKPVKVGVASCWPSNEVSAWQQERIQQRATS